jgi:hypothetical protein
MYTVCTVIAIPGIWSSDLDITNSFSKCKSIQYHDSQITELNTLEKYSVEVYEYDPQLAKSFAVAGYRSLSESDLTSIESHKRTIYLVGSGGTIESSRKIAVLADQILEHGGLGIKVESSGIAYSKNDWRELMADDSVLSLYKVYNNIICNENIYYSCGMHNLGFPDVYIDNKHSIDSECIIHTIESFLVYLLIERPHIKAGDVFSIDDKSLIFTIQYKTCNLYPTDDLFYNPFGFWNLTANINSTT